MTSAEAPSLTVRQLTVRYPALPEPVLAIDALEIPAGSRIAVTGPSGSGKTTFMNMITGLDRASGGRIEWRGVDLAALSESGRDRWRARNVGLVMQDFHLFAGLGALDNVLLPARLASWRLPRGLRERGLLLLARVGIERPDQAVETMSRGQMQRVAVARALLGRPGILVADEPTASLDAASGAAVAGLLLALAREAGATLIVVSHDERLVSGMDRVIRLKDGRIAEDGRTGSSPARPAAQGSATRSGTAVP